MQGTVKFNTSDGEEVEFPKEFAMKSVMVSGIIDDNEAEDSIPLPGISKSTLTKIMEYCEFISKNEDPQICQPIKDSMKDSI